MWSVETYLLQYMSTFPGSWWLAIDAAERVL